MEQILLTTAIVAACALYAAWMLMPAAARRWFVRGLLAAPLPKRFANAITPYATAPTGCACDGCDRSASAKPAAGAAVGASARATDSVAPITFHPRRKT